MGKSEGGIENREYTRVPLKTDVNAGSESNFFTGFSQNISEGGLFVGTFNLLAMGTEVPIEFSLPDDGPLIVVKGQVCWIREAEGAGETSPGMGLRFIDLDERDRKRIENYVKNHETIFYDAD